MAAISIRTQQTLQQVLASFLIRASEIQLIRSGSANRHWRVVAGRRQYVLRRYQPRRTPAQIGWEHALTGYLASRRWPAAAPLPAASGETLLTLDGAHYAVFPFIAGRPAPYCHPRYLQIKGRLLARMHHFAPFSPAREQRDGFGPIWELTGAAGFDEPAAFDTTLDRFAWEYPSLAELLRVAREGSRDQLVSLGYGEQPGIPCHMDFHHDNIRFEKGELTGVIDFDAARRDARVSDIAFSIDLDCLEAPEHIAIRPSAAAAWLAGYVEADSLSREELELVVPLIRAHAVTLAASRLSEWLQGSATAVRSIEHWLRQRLPAIEARAPAIESALREVVNHRQ